MGTASNQASAPNSALLTLARLREDRIRTQRAREQAEDMRQSFRKFVPAAWPQMEPAKAYIKSWHIDAICDHLDSAANGHILKLLLTVPPGSAKSLLTCVAFPAWIWTRTPEWRGTFLSYDEKLSTRDSVRCRDLLQSNWYQETFRPTWEFAGDQNEKTYYVNSAKGFRVSGRGTGWRGHALINDDPLNAKERFSDSALAACVDLWDNVLFNRFIDMEKALKIIIMQRLGDRDLAGHVLRAGGYQHLKIPLEYDPTRSKVTTLRAGVEWRDPRKKAGEVMCPELFPPSVVEDIKKNPEAFCTPGYTPILMADWSERNIEDVKVGDEVVGFVRGHDVVKARLEKATVTNVASFMRPVYRFKLKSGRQVHCTLDHKWYSSGHDTKRAQYRKLSMGSKLACVYTPADPVANSEEQRAYDWLGGILDGEGTCATRGSIAICQSSANPEVQSGIDATLTFLNIPFRRWNGKKKGNPKWADRGNWHINGGRSVKMKILSHAKMFKRQRFIDSLWSSGKYLSENIKLPTTKGYKGDHRVASVELIGDMKVYGLTTTTGNYVAWGFASQNSSQYQQEPNVDGGGILKSHKWNYWQPAGLNLPAVRVKMPDGKIEERVAIERPETFDLMLQTWDMSVKDLKTSDFVCGQVHGVKGARRFVLKMVLKRMGIVDTMAAVREMTGDFPGAHLKLIEDKANGSPVVEMLEAEIPGMVRVNPEDGKVARASTGSVDVEAGNWYLPHPMIAPWVGNPELPIEGGGFIASASLFPFGAHDDDVDSWSQGAVRIRKEKIGGIFGISESDIRVDPFDLKDLILKWPRAYGLHIDWRSIGAVWIARQPQTGQHYLWSEYSVPASDPAVHAAAIKKVGDMQGYMVADAAGREKKDGYALVRNYAKLGLHLETIPDNLDTSIADLSEAFSSGKLKVLANLGALFDQYRMFRRDDRGKIPTMNVAAIMAALVAWRARDMLREPQKEKPFDPNSVMGQGSWMSS